MSHLKTALVACVAALEISCVTLPDREPPPPAPPDDAPPTVKCAYFQDLCRHEQGEASIELAGMVAAWTAWGIARKTGEEDRDKALALKNVAVQQADKVASLLTQNGQTLNNAETVCGLAKKPVPGEFRRCLVAGRDSVRLHATLFGNSVRNFVGLKNSDRPRPASLFPDIVTAFTAFEFAASEFQRLCAPGTDYPREVHIDGTKGKLQEYWLANGAIRDIPGFMPPRQQYRHE
ncbi:MAG: hypothetical protein M3O22_00405 [Pseudomonadota bacterium]|nr:hypothetical protein [Pseudomonadota bacterium]